MKLLADWVGRLSFSAYPNRFSNRSLQQQALPNFGNGTSLTPIHRTIIWHNKALIKHSGVTSNWVTSIRVTTDSIGEKGVRYRHYSPSIPPWFSPILILLTSKLVPFSPTSIEPGPRSHHISGTADKIQIFSGRRCGRIYFSLNGR